MKWEFVNVLRMVRTDQPLRELLTDHNFFRQAMAEHYDSSCKEEFQLMDKASERGAGGLVWSVYQRYSSEGKNPPASEQKHMISVLNTQKGFSIQDAQLIQAYYWGMMGWSQAKESHGLGSIMWDHSGRVLMVTAKVLCWSGIVTSSIFGLLVIIVSIADKQFADIGVGLFTIAFGSLSSWLISVGMYAQGETNEMLKGRQ